MGYLAGVIDFQGGHLGLVCLMILLREEEVGEGQGKIVGDCGVRGIRYYVWGEKWGEM